MDRIYVIYNFVMHNRLTSDVTGAFDDWRRVVDVVDRAEDDGDGATVSRRCCIGVVPVVIHFSRGSFVRQHYILLYYYVRR